MPQTTTGRVSQIYGVGSNLWSMFLASSSYEFDIGTICIPPSTPSSTHLTTPLLSPLYLQNRTVALVTQIELVRQSQILVWGQEPLEVV
jgi:hypothetical protein